MEQLNGDQSIVNLNSISLTTYSSCGYCNGKKSQKSWVTSGFTCPRMLPSDYELLINRGWRRCGLYYYKPHIEMSCCQAFCIRLDKDKYVLRTQHKKILRFLINLTIFFYRKINHLEPLSKEAYKLHIIQEEYNEADIEMFKKALIPFLKSQNQQTLTQYFNKIQIKPFVHLTRKSIDIGNQEEIFTDLKQLLSKFSQLLLQKQKEVISSLYPYEISFVQEQITDTIEKTIQTYKILYCKFKFYYYFFIAGSHEYVSSNIGLLLYSKLVSLINSQNHEKYLVITKEKFIEFLDSLLSQANKNFNDRFSYKVYNNFLIQIKSDQLIETIKLKEQILKFYWEQNKRQSRNSRFEIQTPMKKKNPICKIKIRMVPAQYDEECYKLYCRYQKVVHGKEYVTKESYQSFICSCSLVQTETLGCKHMKYYLGDQLIAVGVIDVLPNSVSSVYFFYDPLYRKYSLGVYGVLKELDYMKSMKNLKYYYLGFYIQDSPKLIYKRYYKQTELLCPLTYNWVDFDTSLSNKIDDYIKQLKSENNDVQIIFGENKMNQIHEKSNIQEHFQITMNKKCYHVSQLKYNYRNYLTNLFIKLQPLLGLELMKKLQFSYNC